MFTSHQSLVLAILSENPQKEHHLHELGRLVGKKPGVFQRGINSLEKQGLLISRKEGNLRLFKINEQHPLYKEVKAFVRKSVGIEAELKKIVSEIKGIKMAVIYGSYAKGAMRTDSDIDLLIVTTEAKAEDRLVDGLARVEKAFGREVNYKLYDKDDFGTRRSVRDPFLAEILSDKHVVLKGSI